MGEEKNRLSGVLESLRGLSLGPVNERLGPEIQRLVAEALDAAQGQDQGQSASGNQSASLALVLRRLADRHKTGAVAASCLSALVRLSPFGVVLAAALLRNGRMDLEQAFDCLVDLSPADRLTLADRLLLDPASLSPDLRRFALERLVEVAEESVLELGRHLRRPEIPAFAVAQAALDGALGRQCRQALARSRNQTEVRECAGLLARYAPWDMEKILSGRLAPADPNLRRAMLDGLSAMTAPSEVLAAEVLPVLKQILHLKDHAGAKAAILALLALRPQNLGRVLAECLQAEAALTPFILTRLHRLGAGDYALLRKSLGETEAPVLALRLFLLLGRTDPRPLLACLKWCLAEAARKDPAARPNTARLKELQALFTRRQALQAATPAPPKGLPRYDPQAASEADKPAKSKVKTTAFATIESSGTRNPAEERKSSDPRLNAQGQLVKGLELGAKTLDRANLSGSFVQEGRFDQVRFTGGFFQGTRFVGCHLREVTFIDCDLRQTRWHDLDLDQVTFTGCDLAGALFSRVEARRLRLEECSLSGARLLQVRIQSGVMHNVDATGLLADDCQFLGLEFSQVLFDQALFEACSFEPVALRACGLAEARGRALAATHPNLTALMARTLTEDLAALESGEAAAQAQTLTDLALLADCAVRRWFELGAFKAGLDAFLVANVRRESWCAEKLGPEKTGFYRLLPLLLHQSAFDRALGLSPDTPTCRVAGYAPDEAVLSLARTIFADADLVAEPKSALTIEAVFTIGSLGSVAQDPHSDLDYWVCADLAGVGREKTTLLQRKLEAISLWADQKFSLEAHFFLMDVEDVRRNNFGFSDEESSGSAQALMLKEEFYRTAVLAAGKPPLWWLVPPGAGERTYAMAKARVNGLLGPETALDLGHVDRIPEAEFFGASLWQIVKGLKSPFKSVMKFALLERYIRGGSDAPLLCDRLKSNLTAGRTRLWEVDPYVLLYREVTDHYRRMNDQASVELIALAFLLKTGLEQAAPEALPLCRAEERDTPELFAQVAEQNPEGIQDLLRAADPTYENIMALGARVNQFLINTYTAVRDSMPAGAQALITPEDLTKLGRKIFSTFAKRPNKVEIIPFLEAMQASLSELRVSAQAVKAGRVWKLDAGVLDESLSRVRITPLKQGKDLAPILAWTALNGLARDGVTVKADLSVSPLTAQDLSEAMQAMALFFKPILTHEGSIGESLNPERIIRAFFLLNLTAPRESTAVLEGQLVYATNWGEIFCVDVPAERPLLKALPVRFLREVLPLETPDEVILGHFLPPRSQCFPPDWTEGTTAL